MEFLRQVARVFVENEYDNLSGYCFVFPNRRSLIFFQKYLGEESGRAMLSPGMMTVSDLFVSLSGLEQGDRLELMYRLYTVYTECTGSVESFDDFLYWGDVILNDFDDVDKYMADASRLFSNLSDLKELESDPESYLDRNQLEAVRSFWRNFASGNRKDGVKGEFLKVWTVLEKIYLRFRESLLADNIGYEGMIYRAVAEDREAVPDFSKVVFIGLNAPNRCERELMKRLLDRGMADFYWDCYGRMLEDKDNTASHFLKEYVKEFPSSYMIEDGRDTSNLFCFEKAELIAVPSAVGQTKVAGRILSDLFSGGQDDDALFRTAVVLPEENLLMPLLSSLPECIDKVNVTMGYPLSFTAVKSFMDMVASLQKNAVDRNGRREFHYKDIVNLLNHPFLAGESGLGSLIRERILKGNMIHLDAESLSSLVPTDHVGTDADKSLVDLMFGYVFVAADDSTVPSYVINLLEKLGSRMSGVEREFVYYYFTVANRLVRLALHVKGETFFRLLSKYAASMRIPFRGEPLAGLQIMGNLETRALDFENLIILSVNEGVYPAKSVAPSMIPYNLRKGFSLPTYELQDAIAAYYFYRLACRAKRIYLIYNTRTDGMKNGEVSRYVHQLGMHYGVGLDRRYTASGIESGSGRKTVLDKTPEMVGEMKRLFGNVAFSASSVNAYLDCSLMFYYRYVLQIKEELQPSEDVDARLFGTIFHGTMERVYRRFVNGEVSPETLGELVDHPSVLRSEVVAVMQEYLPDGKIEGANIIIREIVLRYVIKVLRTDMELGRFMYLGSESKYRMKVDLGDTECSLVAYIDRLDKPGDGVRIVDYKTGNVNMAMKEVSELFDRNNPKRSGIMLQMLMYAMMYRNAGGRMDTAAELSVYSLKDMFRKGPVSVMVSSEIVDEFEEGLKAVLAEIFNPEVPFEGTDDDSKCEYCQFRSVCNR